MRVQLQKNSLFNIKKLKIMNKQKRWGYNDLQRRKQDFCNLIRDDCSGYPKEKIIPIIKATSFIPFPKGSH